MHSGNMIVACSTLKMAKRPIPELQITGQGTGTGPHGTTIATDRTESIISHLDLGNNELVSLESIALPYQVLLHRTEIKKSWYWFLSVTGKLRMYTEKNEFSSAEESELQAK